MAEGDNTFPTDSEGLFTTVTGLKKNLIIKSQLMKKPALFFFFLLLFFPSVFIYNLHLSAYFWNTKCK